MKDNKMPAACMIVAVIMFAVMSAAFIHSEIYGADSLTNEDFIRLHVVANSDSEEDQALKLKVRDGVIEYIDDALVREAVEKSEGKTEKLEIDINDSREYIIKHMDEIVDEAEAVLAAEGVYHNVRAEYGVSWIPEKEYDSVTFPAGNYEALKILIGEASGHNWWCVIFPPLCLIDSGDPEKDEKLLNEVIMNSRYSQLKSAPEEDSEKVKLKLKFKTLEVVKRFSE